MNLLVMGMNYAPELTGIGPFTTELCEYLASQGHCVSVATAFPHYPGWEVQQPYRGKLFLREERNGVLVHRGYVYVPGKPRTSQRIVYDSSLSVSAFFSGLAISHVDAILAISPPLQLGLLAWVLSKVKSAAFVLQLQDLTVDAAVAVGMLRNPWAVRLARILEASLYAKAEAILVICQGFADNLKNRGVPESKILVLSNWVDTEFIHPLERINSFRRTLQLDKARFVVLHAGNMGVKQGLDNAIRAARQLSDLNDILLLLVGEGSDKARLVDMVNREGVSSVRFLPLQPRGMLPQMLSAADVLLLNQLTDVVDTVVPSKLLTYMAAGRPVVAAVHPDSEAAKYIRRADCGLVVPPGEPKLLADAIRQVYSSPELAVRLGRNGRTFAEEHFARQRILQQFDDFFRRLELELSTGHSVQ